MRGLITASHFIYKGAGVHNCSVTGLIAMDSGSAVLFSKAPTDKMADSLSLNFDPKIPRITINALPWSCNHPAD